MNAYSQTNSTTLCVFYIKYKQRVICQIMAQHIYVAIPNKGVQGYESIGTYFIPI